MTDDTKISIAQGAAWFAGVIGAMNFEIWLALAGFGVSAFIAWTNYRSRKLQDRLLQEEAERSRVLHDLEVARLRRGLKIPPAHDINCVHELVEDKAQGRESHEP